LHLIGEPKTGCIHHFHSPSNLELTTGVLLTGKMKAVKLQSNADHINNQRDKWKTLKNEVSFEQKSTSLITPIDHQGESESETGYPSQSVDGCVATT